MQNCGREQVAGDLLRRDWGSCQRPSAKAGIVGQGRHAGDGADDVGGSAARSRRHQRPNLPAADRPAVLPEEGGALDEVSVAREERFERARRCDRIMARRAILQHHDSFGIDVDHGDWPDQHREMGSAGPAQRPKTTGVGAGSAARHCHGSAAADSGRPVDQPLQIKPDMGARSFFDH